MTNNLKDKAEDLIQDCTNVPESERDYKFYIPFVNQTIGFLAEFLKKCDEDEKNILRIQIISDLQMFDEKTEDGYYKDNPDDAIKDFERIMSKVRSSLN